MRLPLLRTLRARLTLATMAIMGAVLLIVVAVVDLGARRTLTGAVDGELERVARRIAERPPGGPGRGGGPRGGPGRAPPGPARRRTPGRPSDADPDALPPAFVRVAPDFRADRPDEAPYDAAALPRARSGETTVATRTLKGATYRLLTRPVYREGARTGEIVAVLQLPMPFGDVVRSLDSLRRILLILVLPVGVLLTGLASLALVSLFMRPLRRIRGEAEAIGERDLRRRLPVVGADEFAGLSATLNGMLARIESAFERERGELERQRRFTADASHELKTPLAVVKSHTGLLLHFGGTDEERRESVEEIDAAAGRMTRLVNEMLLLARTEEGGATRYVPFDLREAVTEAVAQIGDDGLAVTLPETPVTILGSREDLARVVVNLVANARKHSGTERPIEIALAPDAVLTVRDHGRGIPPEHLPHLFERFYRGDASRSSETGGTGLGLAIVKGLVEAHKGTIAVESQPERGTVFVLTLPPV